MIKTTYVSLAAAAELLKTDVDTLLTAAAERRVEAYWLMNDWVDAERVRYAAFDQPDGNPVGQWETLETVRSKHFLFVPLHFSTAAEFLLCEKTIPTAHRLSKADADGCHWQPIDGFDDVERPAIGRENVYLDRTDLEQIQAHGLTDGKTAHIPDEQLRSQTHPYLSDDVMLMLQAARKFWGNAKRGEPDTQHSIDTVAAWLEQRGMSESRAKQAASLIRPSWAHIGRKPLQ